MQTLLKVQQDGNNSAYLACSPGTQWQAIVVNAGAFTTVSLPTFDPTAHAWWMLTESSGQWLFSTSPDGFSWTQLAAIPYSWSPHAVSAYFVAGASIAGQTAYIEHVNTPAGASPLMPSWPSIRFQVAFNTGGAMTTQPSYVDLSSRLRGTWSVEQSGRQYELDQIQSGQMTVSLWNLDGALDALNSSSPYYPNVVPMRACRLQAVWPPTRNALPQGVSTASSVANLGSSAGSFALTSGLPPAPTGHTAAVTWTIPASTAATNLVGLAAANNGGAGWPVSDASALPVVGGQPYTFSCWVAQAAGGDATLQAAHRVSWYDVTGARITVSIGSAVTVPVLGTSWALLTYTVTAPATAVGCRPSVQISSSPASASTMYVTAWQMERAAAATPWTAGGVIYPLWSGFVERWPQHWQQQGTYGLVDLTCIDVLAGLSQFTLQPSLMAGLMALGPDRLYPLDELQGSVWWRDASGKHGATYLASSPYGAGTVTSGSSVSGSGFVGAPGPVVTMANATPSSFFNSQGSFINLGTPNGPPSGSGWTRIICFRTSTLPPAGTQMALWWWQSSSSSNKSQGGLALDSSGHLHVNSTNAAGGNIDFTIATANYCDGNWHMAALILTPDGKTLNANIDGAGFYNTNAVSVQPTGITSDTIGMNVQTAVGNYLWAYSGDLAYAVEVPTNNVPSFSDLAAGFATGWAGETSAVRAQRILTMCGYGGTVQAEAATIAMGGANLAGTDPMTALELVGDTEAGQVYVDAAGTLWLTGRKWRYLQPQPAVVFGEQQAAGEVPYFGDVVVELDPTHIYNVAQITNQAAPGAPAQPMQPANNTASQVEYLPRTLPRQINAQDPTLALAAGQYLVSQYGQPQPRLSTLTVDPASNPALWSQVLGLGFGARAQVNRRPPSGPGAAAISLQQFVEHVTWEGDDQGNLKVRLQLTPAGPFLGWWVAAALHTTVATASTAGTATVTLAALTGSATNPAAAVLAPGTVLTLGYGTASAENLTVKSVAATSPGYTSVAVTFTANTVHNHPVGDVVCQPLPSGLQLPAATAAGYPASLDGGATLSAAGPRAAY
ncbi:hypothetical protein E6W39_24170 [Kitasatospora acidiphila]|uniref:Uncharacterized protein n=1 Tax=Kitasatospora acidiphila TaxID=2567942 RepID=A0A540W706_9ACTN|nr:hypothetical protein [Kitasatospora acidiphila]TQF04753.1 hypothetical protein E6W39_24170 [Kitasatospora acidiphila]